MKAVSNMELEGSSPLLSLLQIDVAPYRTWRQILMHAAYVIEVDGHCKNTYADLNAGTMCLISNLRVAAGYQSVPSTAIDEKDHRLSTAMDKLFEALPPGFKFFCDHYKIATGDYKREHELLCVFNNWDGVGQDEIVHFLRKAANQPEETFCG